MSEWVGVDGLYDTSLIQAGIQECPDPSDTSRFYIQPWWEMLPATQTNVAMTVAPGNSMTVDIGQITGTNWGNTVTDNSTGRTFTIDQTYSGPLESAEWIVEAPQAGGSQTALAAYSATGFASIVATGAQTSLDEIVMDQNGVQVSTPLALVSGPFNVAYGDVPPAAP